MMKDLQLTNRIIEPFHNSQRNLSLVSLSSLEQDIQRTGKPLLAANLTRRRFFKTVGLLTGSVVAFDTLLFSKEAEAIPWGYLLVEATKLLGKALLGATAGYLAKRGVEYILEKIREARIVELPYPRTFHEQFSEPVKFDWMEPPIESRFGYFFGIDGYAQTEASTPISSGHDLNVHEIWSTIDPGNPANYRDNSFFVPFPDDGRREPGSRDSNVFYNTPLIYKQYGIDPHMFKLEYVRHFYNGRNTLTGYGVSAPHLRYRRGFLLVGGRA
jgi:hypothetical protein